MNISSLVHEVSSPVAAGIPCLTKLAIINEPLKLIKFDMSLVSMPTYVLNVFIITEQ
jgi:hypothetical protein